MVHSSRLRPIPPTAVVGPDTINLFRKSNIYQDTGCRPTSFRRKFHFYQLEANNIVKVVSWTWTDQRAVGDRARCGRFEAEVLLLNSLMNTSFWRISGGATFSHRPEERNLSHVMRVPLIALIGLSTIHTCGLSYLHYSAPQENNIKQWSNPRSRLWYSYLICRSLGRQNLCVGSPRYLAIWYTMLGLVLTADEMLFSDGGFKMWEIDPKLLLDLDTVSVHYVTFGTI